MERVSDRQWAAEVKQVGAEGLRLGASAAVWSRREAGEDGEARCEWAAQCGDRFCGEAFSVLPALGQALAHRCHQS